MRILLISSLYGVTGGGAGLTVSYLAQGLSAAGNHVAVLTLGDSSRYLETEEQGIHFYRLRTSNIYPFERKNIEPLWKRIIWQLVDMYNFLNIKTLRKILIRESPEIIHIHKMRGLSGSVWAVAAKLMPGRVIQTCHDYESMSPEGLLQGSIGRMALEKRWPLRGYQLLRARFSCGVSIVTAPSRFTLQRIRDSGLFPMAQGQVIANTHGWSHEELQSLGDSEVALSSQGVRFLFLGRLESEKGIRELCEAFLRAVNSHPQMELDIAGWGTLESELRDIYGSHPGIHFLGMVQGKSKMDALRNATVVIIPSLVDEVFGLVTVEAYAFGKPVIASNVGGLPELVRHGETGWLAEPGDIRSLVDCMLSVATMDVSSLEKLSKTCKDFSYQFSMQRVLAEYFKLYEKLLSSTLT
jgi:glycosyltransferase involved in cell wall biosynthesis